MSTNPLADRSDPPPNWWERFPGRLEREREALEKAGVRVDAEEFAELREDHGVIRWRVWVDVDGPELCLIATFPDLYPYFRPIVQASDLDLSRHQHPFFDILCLLAEPTRHWDPAWTLADLLAAQLQKVVATDVQAGQTTGVQPIEVRTAEPFSRYYQYWKDASVLIDGRWRLPPAVDRGTLELAYDGRPGTRQVRGSIREIRGDNNDLLGEADPRMSLAYTETSTARWVRVDQPIRTTDPDEFADRLLEFHPHLRRPARKPAKIGNRNSERWDIVGVVFPEETSYGQHGDGWVFLARRTPRSGHGFERAELIRAWRAGPDDTAARAPSLRPLRDKTVLLVGTGALGGPIALDLARAGVGTLRIIEPDLIDPATTGRWPLGTAAAGLTKLEVLAHHSAAHWPYTDVSGSGVQIGAARLDPSVAPNQNELLDRTLNDVDLVIDAAAEIGVQHVMSTLAKERGIDYLFATATPGAWGGLVTRLRAESRACWSCFILALGDTIPPPPHDPSGAVDPPGCGSPTFTGTSFDLAPIVTASVRLAVATLCRDDSGGYPDLRGDVLRIALRDDEGQPVPVDQEFFPLDQHHSCSSSHPHKRLGDNRLPGHHVTRLSVGWVDRGLPW